MGFPGVNCAGSRIARVWPNMCVMVQSKAELLATLAWLVEAGADEALVEHAVDRFALPPPPAARSQPVAAPPAVAPRPAPSGDGIADAQQIAARCATLAELQSALERYEGCALKASATSTVFADGTPDHGILCIGEAPGQDEDRAGLPFVGRAGKLLDRMLAAIGLDRSKVYIINVLPWRPPDNRTPEPTEIAQCLPFLRRHIELARPKIIVLLGAVSTRNVLGTSDGIMRLRGRWQDYFVDGQRVPVMPTLHPAYLLRLRGFVFRGEAEDSMRRPAATL